MYENVTGFDQTTPTRIANSRPVRRIQTLRIPVLDEWSVGANVSWDYKPIPDSRDEFDTRQSNYTGKAE